MTAKELMEERQDRMWRPRDTEFILARIRQLEEKATKWWELAVLDPRKLATASPKPWRSPGKRERLERHAARMRASSTSLAKRDAALAWWRDKS